MDDFSEGISGASIGKPFLPRKQAFGAFKHWLGVPLLASLTLACAGGDPEEAIPMADPPAPEAENPTEMVPEDVPEPDLPAPPPAAEPPTTDKGRELPSAGLRRLLNSEYRASVKTLFGVELPAEQALPDDAVAPDKFQLRSVGAAGVSTSGAAVFQYAEAADRVAALAFAPEAREALAECAPSLTDPACAQSFVERVGRNVYRRPLSEGEVQSLMAVNEVANAQYADPWKGLEATTSAMLQSPWFIYRAELGTEIAAEPPRRELDAFELATRLAFLTTGSTPDAELLDAAEAAQAPESFPALLEAETARLLSTGQATEQVKRFFGEWLAFDQLEQLLREEGSFPSFTETIGAAMKEELSELVVSVALQREASFTTLFTTRESFANSELAQLYGLAAPAGAETMPITFPEDGPRAGLLTTAGWLASTSRINETSPVIRGHFISERILCRPVPPPPPNVEADLPPAPDGSPETQRQRLERHTTDPVCAGCHSQMDPMGFALEHFDAIGAYRETDRGLAIDATGALGDATFDGARELGTVIADSQEATRCLTKQLLNQAVASELGSPSEAWLSELHQRFSDSGFLFKDLVTHLTASEAFRYAGELR